jgi:antitoxin component YwqK of YwqJK toxin-antitoxin module
MKTLLICLTLFSALLAEKAPIIERTIQFSLNDQGQEVLNGLYLEKHPNQKKKISGQFEWGKKTGSWKEWNKQGTLLLEEHWVNGITVGEQKKWHQNGILASIERYKQGLKHGRFESWYDNEQRKTRAEWSDNVLKGAYQEWHKNGQEKIRCLYVDGKIDGTWQKWNDKGILEHRKLYKNGIELVLNNYSEKYPSGSMKMAYSYYINENNQEIKHGPYNKWFPNGENWLKCEYHHDQLHGLWQYGKIEGLHCRQENYSYGKKDGRCVWYHQGKITREEFWENGKQISQKFYNKDINGNGDTDF